MTGWSRVRLELARTPEFPEGDSSHAYELIVPLGKDSVIDMTAFKAGSGRASFQRLCPGHPAKRGAILLRDNGFALSYEPGDADDEAIFHLEKHRLDLGDYITVIEPDGESWPYKVQSVIVLPPPKV